MGLRAAELLSLSQYPSRLPTPSGVAVTRGRASCVPAWVQPLFPKPGMHIFIHKCTEPSHRVWGKGEVEGSVMSL